MMPSPLINIHHHTRHLCWRSAGIVQVRLGSFDRPAVAPSIKSLDVNCAPSALQEHRRFNAKQDEQPPRRNRLTSAAIAKSP